MLSILFVHRSKNVIHRKRKGIQFQHFYRFRRMRMMLLKMEYQNSLLLAADIWIGRKFTDILTWCMHIFQCFNWWQRAFVCLLISYTYTFRTTFSSFDILNMSISRISHIQHMDHLYMNNMLCIYSVIWYFLVENHDVVVVVFFHLLTHANSHVEFFLYIAIKWDEEIRILDINYDDKTDSKLVGLKQKRKKATHNFEVMDEYDFNLPSTLQSLWILKSKLQSKAKKDFVWKDAMPYSDDRDDERGELVGRKREKGWTDWREWNSCGLNFICRLDWRFVIRTHISRPAPMTLARFDYFINCTK